MLVGAGLTNIGGLAAVAGMSAAVHELLLDLALDVVEAGDLLGSKR